LEISSKSELAVRGERQAEDNNLAVHGRGGNRSPIISARITTNNGNALRVASVGDPIGNGRAVIRLACLSGGPSSVTA